MAQRQSRSGRPKKIDGARAFARYVVDDRERRARFVEIVDQQLAEGETHAFCWAFEHGYGRPPQALDLNTVAPPIGGPLEMVLGQAEEVAIDTLEAEPAHK